MAREHQVSLLPDQLLTRLGEEILRIQKLTGISPNEPANPVYPQHHEPRLAQARRQLQALGYAIRGDIREGLETFEREAGLPPLPNLGKPVWTALQELRNTDTPITPTRWRTREKKWLPAMRRAIRARAEEIDLRPPRPLFFSDSDTETPDDMEVEQTLEELARTTKSGLPETALVEGLLKDHLADTRTELARLGIDTSVSGDEATVPVAFGLEDVEERLKQLFTACIHKPELRQPPTPEEHDGFLPELANFLDHTSQDVARLWTSFSAKPQLVWSGQNRASTWIKGAKSWLQETGQTMESGLRELVETSWDNLGRLGQYGKAVYTNIFRVIYHSLCEMFERVHDAHALVAQTLAPTGSGDTNIRFIRQPRTLVAVIDATACDKDVHEFVCRKRRRNRMFDLACELLGCLLGTLVRCGFGTMTSGVALVGLTRVAPRILHLGRELAALATEEAVDGSSAIRVPSIASR